MRRKALTQSLAAGLLASSLTLGTLAIAQTSPMTTTGATSAAPGGAVVQPMDQDFFKKAAIAGMTEVEAGKLAVAQGSSPAVKSFGQKMVDDHMKANEQLKTLAMRKKVTIPTAPDGMHQAMLDQLKGQKGGAFDAAFVDAMKKGHAEAISVFTAGSQSKDPDIAQLATTTLPTLKDHQANIPMAGMSMDHGSMNSPTP